MGSGNKQLTDVLREFILTHGSNLFAIWATIISLTLGLRVVEFILITSGHILPDEVSGFLPLAIWWDLIYSSILTLLGWAVYAAFAPVHRMAGLDATYLFITLYLFIALGLLGYFVETLLPLGADFFAYSFSEILTTIETSITLRTVHFFLIALLPGIPLILLWGFQNISAYKTRISAISIWLGICLVLYLLAYPNADRYDHHLTYSLTVNKTALFFQEALRYGIERLQTDDTFTGEKYPLMRPDNDPDVLGRFFETGEHPPNIVIIKVEGLGGSFMPPHAPYGGFTPYLDSLASESLYWTHFLSTSGRSFNAHPSILGSLPYARSGFMDMGIHMPFHTSIVQILNENGYYTSHFSGFDTSFDKLDVFLDHQGIDDNLDKRRFPDQFDLLEEDESGFAWGYADHDLFRLAHQHLGEISPDTPRLDLYFTLNFHEPFIIPDQPYYQERIDQKLNELDLPERQRRTVENYPEVFAALLYTDDAIQQLMHQYRTRPDYDNTIFIITGDHRIGPIAHETLIDRFYVPFLIYSPKLNQSTEFESLGSHLQLPATLTAFLRENYDLATPDSVHWKKGPVDTSRSFGSELDLPLMRNKNQMMEYVHGRHLLSGNQVFQINRGMETESITNRDLVSKLTDLMRDYRSMNTYITNNNKLLRPTEEQKREREELEEEEIVIREHQLEDFGVDELFFYARDLAFEGDYEDSRIILRRLLRSSPNYHDARILYGRTLGWEGHYQQSLEVLREVLRRNPTYYDTYLAKGDIYFWQGKPEETLRIIDEGLTYHPEHPDFLFRKARAYNQSNQTGKALPLLEHLTQQHPDHEDAANLLESIRETE